MTISPKILAAIQKAGTAVFNADTALKGAVADSAKKVSEAMTKNPLDGQHDSLYQNWKRVAAISQAVSAMEAELKNLYALAASEPVNASPALALAAPAPSEALEFIGSVDVTDVMPKRVPRKLKAAKKPAKSVVTRSNGATGLDNSAKVWTQLPSR